MTTKRYIYATSAGVYSTDGTSAGTTLLMAAGTDFVPQTGAQMVTLPNGKVLFFALVNGYADPVNGALEGIQVWETDGTVSGTSMTGSTYSLDGDQAAGDSISNVVAIGSEVSFVSNIPGNSPSLFVTDGTSAGTLPESGTLPQTGLPSTGALTGGSSAPKYIYATSAGVYSTDGTSTGTTLLVAAGTDFVPQTGTQMVTLPNGKVLFFALVNGLADPVNGSFEGIQVWETDGTVSGTSMTGSTPSLDNDQSAGDSIGNVVAIGSEVSFVSNVPGLSPVLFVTNGTSAGTLPESETLPQTGLPSTGALTGGSSAPKYIYATSAGVYATDGTSAGTTLLVAAGTDFVPQTGAQMVTLPNGKVLFFALVNGLADPANGLLEGIQVWETDGTVSGTAMTGSTFSLDDDQTAGDSISNVVAIGSEVSFVSNIPGSNPVLFVTDGTSRGTSPETTTLPQTGLVNGTDTMCFLAGTRIATSDGEVPVQRLSAGGRVLTASGEARAIRWVGRGKVSATRGCRSAATPVIIRKGALADNVPNADLRVTKAHGLYIDEVLIPVEFLVNHRSILWDDHAQDVELYHIELDTHDILLANGAPAESYRDDGNRWLFQNANDGWHLPPCDACATVLTGGPVVDAVWRRLLDRAGGAASRPMTEDPDLHLIVAGQRIDPHRRQGSAHSFRLPADTSGVRIVSLSGIPAELGIARDPRPLGVAIRRIELWQGTRLTLIESSDERLIEGFHAFEPADGLRWTDGDALLLEGHLSAGAELEIHLGGATQYPLLHEPGSAAA